MHKLALVSLTGLLLCTSCSESWTVEGKSDREIVQHYAHEFAKVRNNNYEYYKGTTRDCLPKWGICDEPTYKIPSIKFKVLSISDEPMDMYYIDAELRRVEGGKFEYFPVYYDGIKAYKVNYAIYGKEKDRDDILKTLLDWTYADFEWNLTTETPKFEWTGEYFEGLYDGLRVNDEKTLDSCFLKEYKYLHSKEDIFQVTYFNGTWYAYTSGFLR